MARGARPLVQGWLSSAGLALALWAFGHVVVPAAADMLRPLYIVALVPGIWGTWRWLRPRGAHDRRSEDRRRAPRRTHEDPEHPEHPENAGPPADR